MSVSHEKERPSCEYGNIFGSESGNGSDIRIYSVRNKAGQSGQKWTIPNLVFWKKPIGSVPD